MPAANREVTISVPATSANLGPGFDTLGLALELRDRIHVRTTTKNTRAIVFSKDEAPIESGEENLIIQAMRLAFDQAGVSQPRLELTCHNVIPQARGLGSSAAAVVGGLAAARALLDDPAALPDSELLKLATTLEGHPDNAAPAIFGGATLAWITDGVPSWRPLDVNDRLVPHVFIPAEHSSTAQSRATLPAMVPRADAVFNLQRTAMMTLALSETSLLFDATEDRLHQHYRESVMEPSLRLIATLREQGCAAVLSGAGPTVLSFTQPPDVSLAEARHDGWQIMRLPIGFGVRTES